MDTAYSLQLSLTYILKINAINFYFKASSSVALAVFFHQLQQHAEISCRTILLSLPDIGHIIL